MFFAFSFTLFKEDIALRLCRWVLVSQGQRTGPDLRPQRQTAVKLSEEKRREEKRREEKRREEKRREEKRREVNNSSQTTCRTLFVIAVSETWLKPGLESLYTSLNVQYICGTY